MELNNIEHHDHATVSMKVVLLVFAIVVVAALGWLVYQQNANPVSSGGDSVKTTTTKTTTTTTTDANAVACGTKAYAFDLTFGDLWKGHKIKEAKLSDSIITCYVEMPTVSTDSFYQTAATDHDKGYVSVFAIGVYTPAQWTVATSEGPAPTKLGSNSNYVWGYSQANGVMPSDVDAAYKDINNVALTFKISQ